MTSGKDRKYQGPQPVTSVGPPLIIVADDLTGACDAAVALTPICDSIHIQIGEEPSTSASVQVIVTESRDLPIAEAEARIQNIATRFPDNAELFKKIDSVFRGNTVAEIAATLRHTHFDLALIAPAYPALGRVVRNGVLHIHDASSHRTLPLAELFGNIECSLTLIPQLPSGELVDTLRSCLNNPKPAVLCDAATEDDLARVVRAARALGKRFLWIGSGGLAHALAAEFPALTPKPAILPRPGHTIFFIGSPHPVTRTQIDQLRRTRHIEEHRPDATQPSPSDLLFQIIMGETSARDIRRSVASYDPAQIAYLFMSGGDTAHFVCRALGIQALRLEREFAPGIPLATAEGGPFDGVSIVLKSGGFGEPDLLCRLLETCRPEVTA